MAKQTAINELTECYYLIKSLDLTNAKKTEQLRIVVNSLNLTLEDVQNSISQLGSNPIYWSKLIVKKWVKNAFESSMINNHQIYKTDTNTNISISEEFNALAFMRESVDKGYKLKQKIAQVSNENIAKSLGFNPFSVKMTISGYKSPLLAILENNQHVKAVFVESVDRLSRNLSLTLDLLDYCSLHKVNIYVGSSLMNRGVGRVTLLLLAVFAEFELTAKQTSYSLDLMNVIKFELDLIDFSDLTDSEIKLFNNLQFVERAQVFEKALNLSEKYINRYESKQTDKGGRLLANNTQLYENAQLIINLLTE